MKKFPKPFLSVYKGHRPNLLSKKKNKNRDTVPFMTTWILGWTVEIFLIGQCKSTNQRSGMIFKVQIQIFGAPALRVKVFIFKKFQGAQILIFFFVKIGMKLPFTLKNKSKIQIWNLGLNFLFCFSKYNTTDNYQLSIANRYQRRRQL